MQEFEYVADTGHCSTVTTPGVMFFWKFFWVWPCDTLQFRVRHHWIQGFHWEKMFLSPENGNTTLYYSHGHCCCFSTFFQTPAVQSPLCCACKKQVCKLLSLYFSGSIDHALPITGLCARWLLCMLHYM